MKLKNRIISLITALAVCISITACGAPETTSETPTEAKSISIENTSFVVDGDEIWMNGMNTPWQHWDDFGGNFSEDYWDLMFSMMHDKGMNCTRVWITCSGNVGIEFDENGMVTGATEKHWQNLDTLFALAEKYEVYIMATLISFDHFKDSNMNHMKWRNLIQNSDKIDSYVNNYVIPLCERYDNNDYLWSIDLCNEPDWVFENEECGQLSWDYLGNYFARCAAAIHQNSDILVTVGFAIIKYNSTKYEGNFGSDEFLQSCYDNSDAYLDYYSPHYYEWETRYFSSPFIRTPEEFGLDTSKPIVLAECSPEGMVESNNMTLEECYKWLYDNGWNGILPWTTDGYEPEGALVSQVGPASEYITSIIDNIASDAA